MTVTIAIPQLGESVVEAVLARWHKRDGDPVSRDEVLMEVETDKASIEIPATATGQLRIVVPEGEMVRPGTVVAQIEEGAAESAPAPAPVAGAAPPRPPVESAAQPPPPPMESPAPVEKGNGGGARLTPSARRAAVEYGVSAEEVARSGRRERVTKADVIEYATKERAVEAPAPEPRPDRPAEPAPEEPAPEEPEVRREPMTRIRRVIARRLVEAQHTAAILTTFNEIDMSAVNDLRRRYKASFAEKHGVPLGLMSLFGRAVIESLRDQPRLNAMIDGEDIVHYQRVHLGIAVGTPRGLVVPVVRNADRLDIAGLEREIARLAEVARAGKLSPDQLAGGTFTISNGGVFGSLLSTPILNPPQSGVLGMHKIEDRAVVVDGVIAARPMMYVALSYDHRLVDGEQAVRFLVGVKSRLEDPARMLLGI